MNQFISFAVIALQLLSCYSWLTPRVKMPFSNFRDNYEHRDGVLTEPENEYENDQTIMVWSPHSSSNWNATQNTKYSIETMRWCQNFVVPFNLCPWAKASLQTPGAIRLYSVQSREDVPEALDDVSRLFYQQISSNLSDPTTAISFLICEDLTWDFEDFFEWFCYIEEMYWDDQDDLQNKITLAAFHPDWNYEGDDTALRFEKKAPYPTITFVWTPVVEAATEAATSKIASQNEKTLLQQRVDDIEGLYKSQVYLGDNTML